MIEVTCSPLQTGTSSRCLTTGSQPPIRTEHLTAPHHPSQWKRSRSPCRQTLLNRWYVPAGSFSPFSCLLSSHMLISVATSRKLNNQPQLQKQAWLFIIKCLLSVNEHSKLKPLRVSRAKTLQQSGRTHTILRSPVSRIVMENKTRPEH